MISWLCVDFHLPTWIKYCPLTYCNYNLEQLNLTNPTNTDRVLFYIKTKSHNYANIAYIDFAEVNDCIKDLEITSRPQHMAGVRQSVYWLKWTKDSRHGMEYETLLKKFPALSLVPKVYMTT